MSSADRSGTERIRRLKAITLLNGPITGAIDYGTLQSIDFGKRPYLRQLANGAVVEESCCVKADVQTELAPFQASPGTPFDVSGGGSDIAYGNGLWVAVGTDGLRNGNNILYTTDPSTVWTPSPNQPFGVGGVLAGIGIAYDGKGLWVAVGQDASGSNILYTTDPRIGWSPSPNQPFSGSLSLGADIAYENGLWVAVGRDASGNNILHTTDPSIGWTPSPNQPFDVSGSGRSIAYGNGLWVAVGFDASGSNILYTTNPSIGWTPSPTQPFTNGGIGVTYANGLWVAIGVNNAIENNIVYTTDPRTGWTPSLSPQGWFPPYFGGTAYGNGLWIAAGVDSTGNGNNLLNTNDPKTGWIATPNQPFGAGTYFGLATSIAYANGVWVTVGADTTGNGKNILYSMA